MDRETFALKYAECPDFMEGFDVKTLDAEQFEDYELLAVEGMARTIASFREELRLLGEQYAGDKEVRYVIEVVEIEGLLYTMLFKFNVETYLGYNSTSARLAKMLKSCHAILEDIAQEYEAS